MDRSPRGRSLDDDRRGRDGGSTRIYVGNLPSDCQRTDIEDLFGKYGRIVDISVKRTISGAPFAFIEYEDVRDADHAIRGRDGYEMMGSRLRVEVPFAARGGGRPKGKGTGPPRRGDYRVQVSGLPPSGSWQDLKDHMRTAGECVYAEVFRDGSGIVEFVHRDDMEYAVKNLNGAKFKSHEGEVSRIQVARADRGGDGRRSYDRRSYDRRSYDRRSYDRRSYDRRSSDRRSSDRRSGSDRRRSASRSYDRKSYSNHKGRSRSYSPRRADRDRRRSSPSNDSRSYRSYSRSRSRSRDKR